MKLYRNFADMRLLGWDAIKRTHPGIPARWLAAPLPAVRLKTILVNLRRSRG